MKKKTPSKLVVYTDGSCFTNPGVGGWAFIATNKKEETILHEATGTVDFTTNNRMEYIAAIQAIEWAIIEGVNEIHVISDSQLLIKTATLWISNWKKNGWKKKKRKKGEIKNLDLVKKIDSLGTLISITWTWVKGHNESKWNLYVDDKAYLAALDRVKSNGS